MKRLLSLAFAALLSTSALADGLISGSGSGGGGSVSITAGSACVTAAPSPITGTGTIDVTGSKASVACGGTGLTAGTSGGILGYTAAGTLASSAALTAGGVVLGGGAGATPLVDATFSYDTTNKALTLGGGTVTANTPWLNGTQTWNNAAIIFQGIFENITNTASNTNSTLIDLQVAGATKFNVNRAGNLVAAGAVSGTSFTGSNIFLTANAGEIVFGSGLDTFLTRPGVAYLQHGAVDAAAPVAQTVGIQNVATGTTNTAGVNWTMNGSLSTGSGVSGDIIFQTGGTGAGATAKNALVEAFRITGATNNIKFKSSSTGAGAQTFTNSPCTGLTTERWIPVEITGQSGTWLVPACQ